jgi:hypothetical protein
LRQIAEHLRVNLEARALHAVEQRREREFDLRVDRFEALFEDAAVEHVRRLRGEVCGLGRAPVLGRPAFGRVRPTVYVAALAH